MKTHNIYKLFPILFPILFLIFSLSGIDGTRAYLHEESAEVKSTFAKADGAELLQTLKLQEFEDSEIPCELKVDRTEDVIRSVVAKNPGEVPVTVNISFLAYEEDSDGNIMDNPSQLIVPDINEGWMTVYDSATGLTEYSCQVPSGGHSPELLQKPVTCKNESQLNIIEIVYFAEPLV